MPNRILKESICTSDSIDSLSWFEEVLFYRLIVNCDDYGRFDGRISVIKNRLFPLKENITAQSVKKSIDKLATVGLVALYEFEGKPFLQLPTWENHQTVRAKKSKYPPFEKSLQAYENNCNQLQSNESECSRNPIQSNTNPIRNNESISESDTTTTTTTPSLYSTCAREENDDETAKEPPHFSEIYFYFKNYGIERATDQAELFEAYNAKRGWDCLPNWKGAADLWVARMQEHEKP